MRLARDTGGSERQFRDAVGVFELQGEALDLSYLEQWADCLGVSDLLEAVIAAAQAP